MPWAVWSEPLFIEMKAPRRATNSLVLISPETWPTPSPELTSDYPSAHVPYSFSCLSWLIFPFVSFVVLPGGDVLNAYFFADDST